MTNNIDNQYNISELKNNIINTDENINTEDSDDIIKNTSGKESSNYLSSSLLNRKLKQIKKNDKNNANVNDLYKELTSIDPTNLLNKHLYEIQLRIIGHIKSEAYYDRRDRILGYPVAILSSFVSSTIMMSINDDSSYDKDIIKYIGLSMSITSFMCSITRDYLNFSKKVQSHDLSAKLYTSLLRSTEVRLIKNNLTDDEKIDIFKDLVDQMSIIEQYETPIPDHINIKITDDYNIT